MPPITRRIEALNSNVSIIVADRCMNKHIFFPNPTFSIRSTSMNFKFSILIHCGILRRNLCTNYNSFKVSSSTNRCVFNFISCGMHEKHHKLELTEREGKKKVFAKYSWAWKVELVSRTSLMTINYQIENNNARRLLYTNRSK